MAGCEHENSRRGFIRGSSLLLAGAVPAGLAATASVCKPNSPRRAYRLGLVGCGSRGTALAAQALGSQLAEVRLAAVADVFPDRLQQACRSLKSRFSEQFDVSQASRFVGLHAYQQLLEQPLDLVILAAAPGFRPLHVEAAVRAGTHVFAERPIAVDVPGVHRFASACRAADAHGVAVSVGLQRRHGLSIAQTIHELQQGAIGDFIYARTAAKRPFPRRQPRRPGQSALEFQLRNWQRFAWTGGGVFVEQHVPSLDMINWLFGGHPLTAAKFEGRRPFASVQPLPPADLAHERQAVEFLYEGGQRLYSSIEFTAQAAQLAETVHGTRGWCDLTLGKIYDRHDALIWKAETAADGTQAQFDSLFSSLQAGLLPCEGYRAAESTLTALMGSQAACGDCAVSWEECCQDDRRLADFDCLRHVNDAPPADFASV